MQLEFTVIQLSAPIQAADTPITYSIFIIPFIISVECV